MRALFIYWKARPEDLARALAAAREFQSELSQRHPLLAACLYQRAESGAPLVTLMETYAQPGGLDAAVELAIVEEGFAKLGVWCQGVRHEERFEQLRP